MKKNIAMKNRSRKGVALIFALGILGLMAALGLTFASLSFSEQSASRSTTDRYTAKLLARATAERAIAVLEHNTDIKVKDLISGGESDSALKNHYDFLWRLITKHGDVPGSSKMYKHIGTRILKGDNSPYWQYVIAPNKDDSDEIIGRFAYMAYKPVGLLDPVATGLTEGGTKAKRLGCIADEIDLSALVGATAEGDSKSLAASDITALGTYNANPSNPTTCNTPAELFLHFPVSTRNNLTSASSFATLADKLTASWFSVPRPSYQQEAFWYGTGDNRKLYHRFNLNRTPDEWKDLAVDQIMKPDNLKAYDDALDGFDSATKKANATTAIPWFFKDDDDTKQIAANFLAFFSPTPITLSDWNGRKYWSDTGTPENSTYTANMRTPYINEVIYDINLNMSVEENTPDTSASYTKTFDVTITPTVDVYIELADLYGSLSGITNLKFKASLFKELATSEKAGTSTAYSADPPAFSGPDEIEFTAVPSGVFKPDSGTKDVFPVYKGSVVGNPAKMQLKVVATVAPEGTTYSPATIEFSEKIEKFIMKKLYVLLSAQFSGGSEFIPIDLSNLTAEEEKSYPSFGTADSVFSGLTPFSFSVGNAAITSGEKIQDRRIVLRYQAKDPCANLKAEDWVASDVAVSESTTADLFTATGTNNFPELGISAPDSYADAVSKKMDFEASPASASSKTGYGAKVSTSFIRGRVSETKTIRTPWEIGFIHRGRPFQTLNIKNFADQDAIGDYEKGDAKIFEYLKFTPRGETPMDLSAAHDATAENWNQNRGLINLNDVTAEVDKADDVTISKGNLQAAKALFLNIRRGMLAKDLENESENLSAGTALTSDQAASIVIALAKLNIAAERLDYRSQILTEGSSSGSTKEKAHNDLYNLLIAPGSGKYDAAMEELAGKSILLTSAESNTDHPGDFLVLVGVAQTIKIGSSTVKDKDWLQDGTFAAPNFSAYSSQTDANKRKYERAMVEAGFGYRALARSGGNYKPDFHYFQKLPTASGVMNPSSSDLTGSDRLKKFFPGYDRITATQKVVIWLWKQDNADPTKVKWYVKRLDYVD